MKNKLPVRWSFKKGDRILYRTIKGKEKTFIYGKQTWYRHDLPSRAFRYFRGKLEFRQPNLTEICTKTFTKRSRSKSLLTAVYDNLPIFKHLTRQDGGATITEPIKYE